MMHSNEYISNILKIKGIPQRFLNVSVEDFPNFKFGPRPTSKYLFGSTGVGKTRLMWTMAKELISYFAINTDFEFISVPKLLHDIRQCYQRSDNSEKKIVELYSFANYLFLDDLGVEKTSEWTMQILYLILNTRYEEDFPTIISSNLSLSELSSHLGERITSRISEMCELVKLAGTDRRTE